MHGERRGGMACRGKEKHTQHSDRNDQAGDEAGSIFMVVGLLFVFQCEA